MRLKIAHMTSLHARDDIRIFMKECRSLMDGAAGHVHLIVMDGLGDAEADNVTILDCGFAPVGRLRRALAGNWRMFRAARRGAFDVLHFHDPELMLAAFALRLCRHKVIYDVHEDLPRQLQSKDWIPQVLRRPVAGIVGTVEWIAARLFNRVVAATPTIASRFPEHSTVTVQNFPILSELVTPLARPHIDRPLAFAYIGGITRLRGAKEMLGALNLLAETHKVSLRVAGQFEPVTLQGELSQLPGWSRVNYLGWVGRKEVAALLSEVRAGLVVLHPLPNYVDAQPIKMFEYMAAGLPVIASDFPLWRQIVDGAGCGLLVDPLRLESIAEAMEWILDHPDEAEEMGRRGRVAIEQKYNWECESRKLLELYGELQ